MIDLIQVLERAYDLDASNEEAWLRALAEALVTTLSSSSGALAYTFQVLPADNWIDVRTMCDLGMPTGFLQGLLHVEGSSVGVAALHRTTAALGSAIELIRAGIETATARNGVPAETFDEYYGRAFLAYGFRDLSILIATNPDQSGCVIGFPRKSIDRIEWPKSRWRRIAAHVAAGVRLQWRLSGSAPSGESVSPEAVLTADGKVEHATGVATTRSARERLRAAVLATERARGPLRRSRPDEALEIWQALVAGRWSLVDQFERDGRRFLVAHPNSPATLDPRTLTEREKQVVTYAARGHSNKLIAYELGLSPSTVGVLLARARKKLASGGVSPADGTREPSS